MGLFGSKAKKVTDHKVVKGLAAWAIGHTPVAHIGKHLFFNDIPA